MRAAALVALIALGCAETESPLVDDGTPVRPSITGTPGEWAGRDRDDVYFGAGLRAGSRDGVIQINPSDVTTGAMPEPWIALLVPRRGLDPEEVAALAARYRLVTWPEREEVPADPFYEDAGSTFSRVMIRPRERLRYRWYALRGAGDPREVPAPDLNPRDGDPAVAVSRFLVGPSPVVRRVWARTTGRATTFEIVYTERVIARPESYEVSAGGAVEPRCRLHNATEMEPPGAVRARILCPPLPWSSLVLRQVEPLLGADGNPVRSAAGVPMNELDLPFGVGAGDGSHRREVVPIERDGEVVVLVPTFGLADVTSP